MKKILLILPLLVLLGGCSTGSPDYYDYDNYSDYYNDEIFENDYDSSDQYEGVPQGYRTVYSCNIDGDYCDYVGVEIDGYYVSNVNYGGYTYPSESYCDYLGCYYVDYFGDQWYFDF